MIRKRSAIILGLLALAGIVLIVFPISLGNYLNEKFGAAYVVKTIDDFETEYFTITDWRISNVARSTYVFPYDKLFYHAKLTSKVPYQTIANYILEIKSGDSNRVRADGIIVLNPNSYGEIPIEFSTEHEGYHDIKLTISLYNSTDYDPSGTVTALDQEIRITKLEILSLNDKLLAEQNWYMLAGVIASAIIGSTTLSVLWKERKDAQRQISEFEKQNEILRYKERPWIGATRGMTFHPQINERIVFHYKNYGGMPAIKVREKGGYSSELPTQEFVKSHSTEDFESILVPQQEAQFSFNLNSSILTEVMNKKRDLYLWVIIRYSINKELDGEYGVIYQYNVNRQSFDVKKEWTDV